MFFDQPFSSQYWQSAWFQPASVWSFFDIWKNIFVFIPGLVFPFFLFIFFASFSVSFPIFFMSAGDMSLNAVALTLYPSL